MKKFLFLWLTILCIVLGANAQEVEPMPKAYKNQVGLQVLGEGNALLSVWYGRVLLNSKNNRNFLYGKIGQNVLILFYKPHISLALENLYYVKKDKICLKSGIGFNSSSTAPIIFAFQDYDEPTDNFYFDKKNLYLSIGQQYRLGNHFSVEQNFILTGFFLNKKNIDSGISLGLLGNYYF